jgi:hypothetical protein
MARHTGPKTVQCYHCRHRFEVSGRAESTSCPGCNKPLYVGDIEVKPGKIYGPSKEVRTCGRITVHKRGRMMAESVEAHGGIDCQGTLEARRIVTGRPVRLGPKARYKGDLRGPAFVVEKGARVLPSLLAVPSDPLQLSDLPTAGGANRR